MKLSAAVGAVFAGGVRAEAVTELPKINRIMPPRLKKGDTIAMISPGTNVTDPDDIAKADEALRYFGLVPKKIKIDAPNSGYKSRSVDARLEELHKAFSDNECAGVFCMRGGYASGQLLDSIDYDLIRRNPKVFLGYSDICAMHLAIGRKAGLVTFHGPVLLSAFTSYTSYNFEKMFFGGEFPLKLSNPESGTALRKPHNIRVIAQGIAEGELTGGNLTMVCSLMGTPYEIQTEGKILFLEDVGEEPYRIDRMLNQLRLAGLLSKCKGIIFGECTECDYSGLKSSRVWDYSLGEVIDNYLADLNIPVMAGFTIGHTGDQLTLPLGVKAEINTNDMSVTIKEKPFAG